MDSRACQDSSRGRAGEHPMLPAAGSTEASSQSAARPLPRLGALELQAPTTKLCIECLHSKPVGGDLNKVTVSGWAPLLLPPDRLQGPEGMALRLPCLGLPDTWGQGRGWWHHSGCAGLCLGRQGSWAGSLLW